MFLVVFLSPLRQMPGYYTRRKISPSLSYVTERGEGTMKDGVDIRGMQGVIGFLPYALSLGGLLLPLLTSAGWQPAFIFVTVNEAQRYFALPRLGEATTTSF
jgi:hypothetical protein